MDDYTKKLLEELRGLGVKGATFNGVDGGPLRLMSVEFFPEFVQVPEGVNPNDEDTLPPARGDVPRGHLRAFETLTGKGKRRDDNVSED